MGKEPFHLKIISGQGQPTRSIAAEDSALKNAKYILAVSREAVGYRADSAQKLPCILPELNRVERLPEITGANNNKENSGVNNSVTSR